MTTSTETAHDTPDYRGIVENFDAYDPATAQRVYDVTRWARAQCPVAHSRAHGGYWLVTSYADVRTVLSDPQTFSSAQGVAFPHRQTLMMPPIDYDPPLQKEFRRLLNPHFSRTAAGRYDAAARALAAETAEAFAARGEADLMADFAIPFTAAMLSRVVLNLDEGDLFSRARDVALRISRNDPDDEGDKRAELEAVVEEILHRRAQQAPHQNDPIGALLHGTVEGRPLTRDEQVGTLMILLLGGLNTTAGAITSIFRHVAENPDLEERLLGTDWTRHELDEFLRFEAPVASLSRTVTKDTVLGGHRLKAGETVVLHFASANRDETVFPDADVLDLGRRNNPHLAFSLGAHRCIGSNLARLQIDIAVRELLARIRNIRLVDGVVLVRESGNSLNWTSLPVTFERRPKG